MALKIVSEVGGVEVGAVSGSVVAAGGGAIVEGLVGVRAMP